MTFFDLALTIQIDPLHKEFKVTGISTDLSKLFDLKQVVAIENPNGKVSFSDLWSSTGINFRTSFIYFVYK